MPREVDPKRTRKALRAVRALKAKGEETDYSGWEQEFLTELEQRLDTYGSAFADPSKGRLEEALSMLQGAKLKEIERKAKGKAPRGFGLKRKPTAKPVAEEPD